MNDTSPKTPVHLWIVGVLALLWNAMGAFDYTATQTRLESYMSQFTQEQLDYFYSFPSWTVALWAIAVWGSLVGSILLLLRKSLATLFFIAAVVGLAGTSVHNFILTDGLEAMGSTAGYFTIVIWVIALFLLFYSKAMEKRRVLK